MNKELAIAVIESLRAGIPTRLSTRELPDLRPNVTSTISRDLDFLADGSNPTGRIIWGEYGQGKTHELTCIEHLALDKHFAVSRVTLSRELSGQNLLQLYCKIATSTKTSDSRISGITHKLDKKNLHQFLDSPLYDFSRYTHPLPVVIAENYFAADFPDDRDILYGDLLGYKVPLPEIRKIHRKRQIPFPSLDRFLVKDHGKAYFELMSMLIQFVGYKGWVILIDEMELINRLGTVGRMNAYNNLAWLLNWTDSMNFPIYTVGVGTASLRDKWTDSNSQSLPDKSKLISLAKEKNSPHIAQSLESFFDKGLDSNICLSLAPPDRQQLLNVLKRIVDIHSICFDWKPDLDVAEIIDSIGSKPIRTHIRATLESLDYDYLYKEIYIPEAGTTLEPDIDDENEGYFVEENGI